MLRRMRRLPKACAKSRSAPKAVPVPTSVSVWGKVHLNSPSCRRRGSRAPAQRATELAPGAPRLAGPSRPTLGPSALAGRRAGWRRPRRRPACGRRASFLNIHVRYSCATSPQGDRKLRKENKVLASINPGGRLQIYKRGGGTFPISRHTSVTGRGDFTPVNP